MQQKNDAHWKGLLEETFEDMLRFAMPEIDIVMDLDRGIHFLDKELLELYPVPAKGASTRHVDKLAKVFTWEGEEQWILAHVEVQAHDGPGLARRMLNHYCRLLDRFNRPVTALVIFPDGAGQEMPDRYDTQCLGTRLVYRYNVVNVTDCTDEELGDSENPFAQAVLVAKKMLLKGRDLDARLLEEKTELARLLFDKGLFTKRKIKAVFRFLNNYVTFENPETQRLFESRLDAITGRINAIRILGS